MNNVQDRLPLLGGVDMNSAQNGGPLVQWGADADAPALPNDRINRFVPSSYGGQGGGISAMQIVQQLLAMIQQLLCTFGLGKYFQSASASSSGDPHLAFCGTDAQGKTTQAHFDSMSGHTDLLDSNSIDGGYRISTTVTQPRTNGITYNQQAGISTDYGQTQVCLDRAGTAYIEQNGTQFTIAAGQSYDVGNGEQVRRDVNGSVIVTAANGRGGSIVTTLSENGQGVDVNTQAHDVELYGDLVTSS